MKAATLAEIKKELKLRDPNEILEICLRLGRFKKDNKELITYLLFDARDEQDYIHSIKYEIDELVEDINTNHLYYVKKSLRKISRNLNKYIRYSGNKQTEMEVLLYFAQTIKKLNVVSNRSPALVKMYMRLVQRIQKVSSVLHEDIQADYEMEVREL